MTRRCTREGVEWNPGGPCGNGEVDRLSSRAFLAESRALRIALAGVASGDPAFVLRVTHAGVSDHLRERVTLPHVVGDARVRIAYASFHADPAGWARRTEAAEWIEVMDGTRVAFTIVRPTEDIVW